MDPLEVSGALEECSDNVFALRPGILQFSEVYDVLESELFQMFNPSRNSPTSKRVRSATRKVGKPKTIINGTGLSLDLDFITSMCSDFKIVQTPTEGELKFLGKSFDLFKTCLIDCGSSDLTDSASDSDAIVVFESFWNSFTSMLDRDELKKVELSEGDFDYLVSESDLTNSKLEYSIEFLVIKQLFIAMILLSNWCFQLSSHVDVAISIAKCEVKLDDPEVVLNTAFGIKECNRNMTFYNNVASCLLKFLGNQNSKLDALVSSFLGKVEFLKQMIGAEKVC